MYERTYVCMIYVSMYACIYLLMLSLTAAFKPASKAELITAIEDCLKVSTDCSKGPHAPIGDWDVTAVTDMSKVFVGEQGKDYYVVGTECFNGDILK